MENSFPTASPTWAWNVSIPYTSWRWPMPEQQKPQRVFTISSYYTRADLSYVLAGDESEAERKADSGQGLTGIYEGDSTSDGVSVNEEVQTITLCRLKPLEHE